LQFEGAGGFGRGRREGVRAGRRGIPYNA
jgi:hypothetical protein